MIFCRNNMLTLNLLIILANSLYPNQARHKVGPDLDTNCLLDTLIVFLIEFLVIVGKKNKLADNKKVTEFSSIL